MTSIEAVADRKLSAPAIGTNNPDPLGDIGEMFRAQAGRLEEIVRLDVRASDAVVEDACQFAWDRLIHHRNRIRSETALSWLARTAVREAFKLIRCDRRCLSLDGDLREINAGPPLSAPDDLIEQRERLALVRSLPERQQRLVWLHGLGLSYVEIAAYTGDTPRTVERQLLRAKRAMRGLGEG